MFRRLAGVSRSTGESPEADVMTVAVSHLLLISALPLGVSNLHVKGFLESESPSTRWGGGEENCPRFPWVALSSLPPSHPPSMHLNVGLYLGRAF